MKYKSCPNCGTEHKEHIKKCGCGYEWKSQESKVFNHNTGCSVIGCPMPGTITDSVRGSETWFCRYHDYAKQYGYLAVIEVTDRIKNNATIIKNLTKLKNSGMQARQKPEPNWPDYNEKDLDIRQWVNRQIVKLDQEIMSGLDEYKEENNRKDQNISYHQLSAIIGFVERMNKSAHT